MQLSDAFVLAPIAQICRGINTTSLTEAYISAVRQWCRSTRWFESQLLGSTTAPITTDYTTGTVTVTNNNAGVTGSGTLWLANVAAGDTFTGPNAVEMEVESVTSNTALVLTAVYAGGTLAGQAYTIGRDRYPTIYSLGSDTYNEVIDVRAVALAVSSTDVRALVKKSSTNWDPADQAAVPDVFQYVDEGQLAVHPKPDAAYDLTIALIVQPKIGSNSIDEALLLKWDRAFRAGALMDLLRIPGMPWTNEREAARNEAQFMDWINRGRSSVEKRYEAPVQPW